MTTTTAVNRPDGVVWSPSSKKMIILELTMPIEENIAAAEKRKVSKYTDLVDSCQTARWKTTLLILEVG